MIGDRRTQQAQVEFPIRIISQIHRLFHRFVSFEELPAIEECYPSFKQFLGRADRSILLVQEPDCITRSGLLAAFGNNCSCRMAQL